MATETGKQRSQRIQIDYYQKQSGLDRWRGICVILGTVVGIAFALFAIATADNRSSAPVSLISTGELAVVHQEFENRCDECHRPFSPINPRAVGNRFSFVGIDKRSSLEHLESTCSRCHKTGNHHRELMQDPWRDDDQNCAICHADHQGRLRDLSQVSNQQCIHCHDKLTETCAGDSKTKAEISGFSMATHGDFRSLESGDPGRVKFDHAQHMRPGQVDEGTRGGTTMSQIPPEHRNRYQDSSSEDSLVQLRCADCHTLSGLPGNTFLTSADREVGRHFDPIRFEQHCEACHAITAGVATEDALNLPHAVPWSKTKLLLSATIQGARRIGQARQPGDDTQAVPQVGVGFGRVNDNTPGGTVDEWVGSAVDVVTEQCKQCHVDEDLTDAAIAGTGETSPIIPTRWLKHGIYDHARHREIDCQHCHQGTAEASVKSPPNDHNVVMIAGIESCSHCHRHSNDPSDAPQADLQNPLFGTMPTWGSDSCTLCHRYHSVPEPDASSDAGASP